MFDSYNYVRNNVISNLKKYKYYACIQSLEKTKNMSVSNTSGEVVCYYTNNSNVTFDFEKTTIYHLQNDNGKGYQCSFNLNTKNTDITSLNKSVTCSDVVSFFSDDVSVYFRPVDYIYTNIPNQHYSSFIEDVSSTSHDSSTSNLTNNQEFMYLIPFSMLLVVLALWWFRK